MKYDIVMNKLFSFEAMNMLWQPRQTMYVIKMCKLAVTLAKSGKKVLIIDCDFEKPKLHLFFKIHNSIGLSDILIGESTLEDAAQIAAQPRLCIIPSGLSLEDSSDLLESEEMKSLTQLAEKKFDAVLLVL